MRHFFPLERCSEDGAYRYLAAREAGYGFEIVVIHQDRKTAKRTYRTVAAISKNALDIHGAGNKDSRKGGDLLTLAKEIRSDVLALVTKLESRNQ